MFPMVCQDRLVAQSIAENDRGFDIHKRNEFRYPGRHNPKQLQTLPVCRNAAIPLGWPMLAVRSVFAFWAPIPEWITTDNFVEKPIEFFFIQH
jgi:hypothetical protein